MEVNRRCPCCSQWLPQTDFRLYPKSGAAIRDGYVVVLGPVRYRIVECLHKCYPDFVPTERLMNYLYAGTTKSDMDVKTLHAHMHGLRRDMKILKCEITSHVNYGYALKINHSLLTGKNDAETDLHRRS